MKGDRLIGVSFVVAGLALVGTWSFSLQLSMLLLANVGAFLFSFGAYTLLPQFPPTAGLPTEIVVLSRVPWLLALFTLLIAGTAYQEALFVNFVLLFISVLLGGIACRSWQYERRIGGRWLPPRVP
ncbi:hypothetical protein HYV91_00070 [Candidatus Wolfebacteria bacterium]|nr:hypothetical protein [Candidatus Wolfebacteria bacterium]